MDYGEDTDIDKVISAVWGRGLTRFCDAIEEYRKAKPIASS
jgi:hypothetical protein